MRYDISVGRQLLRQQIIGVFSIRFDVNKKHYGSAVSIDAATILSRKFT